MTITQSKEAPLVVIGGVTGNQGGSVLDHLEASYKPYRLRGITRDVSKPKAQELSRRGVEMVSADLKPENKARIKEVYRGADVVFAVTNFWEHLDKQRETDEGKAMVDAAIAAGVKLFIFSALPKCSELSGGKYTKIHHFESKAAVSDYGRSKASPEFNFRTVEAGWYMTNVLRGALIRKDKQGRWELATNSDLTSVHPLPTIDIPEDYGCLFERWLNGMRPVLASSYDIHFADILKQLSAAAGVEIAHRRLTDEEVGDNLKGTPYDVPHIVEDLIEGNHHNGEFGCGWGRWHVKDFGGQDVHWVDQYLASPTVTFEDWLKTDLSEYQS